MAESITNINPKYPKQNMMPALVISNIVQLLRKHSIKCIYEQSYKCPCADVETGQAKPNCKACHGQGWIYLHPKTIDIALQSDKNEFTITNTGSERLGSTLATPQITINEVEQGIKPGDRITVPGWTTNENYTFNVTQSRLNKGIFIPYKVERINEAFTLDSDDNIEVIDEGKLTLNDNWLTIEDDDLLDKTISLSLEITKRFYVVTILKELRYQKYLNLNDKKWALGNPVDEDYTNEPVNIFSSYGNLANTKFPQVRNRDGNLIVPEEEQLYRLPPQLLLRRENLYFSNINLVQSERDNNMQIKDPRADELYDFIGGE